jgi:hypothetical protein
MWVLKPTLPLVEGAVGIAKLQLELRERIGGSIRQYNVNRLEGQWN